MAWLKPHAIGRSGALKRGWEAIILASKGNPRKMNTDEARVRGGGIPKWPSRDYADNNKALKIKRGNPENRKETRSPSSVVIAAEDDGLLNDYDKYFIVGRPTTREKGPYNNHPSVKPVSLLEHLVLLLDRPAGPVLDPFVGSGSTLIAALNLDVPGVGIEIDPDYFGIAAARLDDAAFTRVGHSVSLFNR
jgi:DNA modification methylase